MANSIISKIDFKESLPDRDDYWELFNTTGWNDKYKFGKDDLEKALKNSWYVCSAYDKTKLIGFGRVISDGIHHALIVDLIVDPKYRGKGIGTFLLNKLLDKCKSSNIRDIQLFSAKDKFGFYERFGFKKRADNAPGMGYKY